MSKKENVAVVQVSAADRARHTRAYNAVDKAEGTYRALVGELAKAMFPEGTTVADFAKALSWDISMGKKATIDKGEANRRRARISDGLKNAELLIVNKRMAQAQGTRRKDEQAEAEQATEQATGAADAADKAKAVTKAAKPAQSALFSAFVGIVSKASKNTLKRMANELATRLAELEKAA